MSQRNSCSVSFFRSFSLRGHWNRFSVRRLYSRISGDIFYRVRPSLEQQRRAFAQEAFDKKIISSADFSALSECQASIRDGMKLPILAVYRKVSLETIIDRPLSICIGDCYSQTDGKLDTLFKGEAYYRISAGNIVSVCHRKFSEIGRVEDACLDLLTNYKQVMIVGSAGTGKTSIAIQKAIHCASAGMETLYVCYNRLVSLELTKELSEHGVTSPPSPQSRN